MIFPVSESILFEIGMNGLSLIDGAISNYSLSELTAFFSLSKEVLWWRSQQRLTRTLLSVLGGFSTDNLKSKVCIRFGCILGV